MSESPFIHLAIRSSYSLLESMISPKDVKAWCEEHLVPAVAITDRNNLFGALEISLTLSGAGIQPIMACCFDVVEDVPRAEPSRLSLYAQNEAGYRRLMYLSSRAYLDAADGVPKLSRALVMEQTEGLIVLTGGAEGDVAKHLLKGRVADARTELSTLASAYPGRCYVEITRHGTQEERTIEEGLIDLAYELELPIVATHDARFMKPDDAQAHDAMMCISNGEYLGQPDRKQVSAQQYLKSPSEMRLLFADLPEAIENTVEIARGRVRADCGRSSRSAPARVVIRKNKAHRLNRSSAKAAAAMGRKRSPCCLTASIRSGEVIACCGGIGSPRSRSVISSVLETSPERPVLMPATLSA